MTRYAYKDNAVGNLSTGISTGDLTLVLDSGDGAAFPSPTVTAPAILTLVQYSTPTDPTSSVVYYEKINVTVRSTDTLTATERGVGDTTAHTFNEGDYIYLNMTEDFITGVYAELDAGLDPLQTNYVIDGGFTDWQSGTSFVDPAGYTSTLTQIAYGADGGTNPTLTHTQQTDAGESFYRIAASGAGSGYGTDSNYTMRHNVYQGARRLGGAGKYVTVTFEAKSDIGSKKIGVTTQQYYGTGGSPSATDILGGGEFTLTSSWAEYTVTVAAATLSGKIFGTAINDRMILDFIPEYGATYGSTYFGAAGAEDFVGAGNIDIRRVRLHSGSTSYAFVQDDQGTLDAKIKKFYVKTFARANAPGTASDTNTIFINGLSTSSVQKAWTVRLDTHMIGTPTLTVYDYAGNSGKWAELSTTGVSTENQAYTSATRISSNGFLIYKNASTTPGFQFHYVLDARL